MGKPEILAPAGNYEAFLAAVHNGCDAVYLGGQKFGARAYAGNFDIDTLKKVVNYSTYFHVQIHYTINTLIKEDEVEDLLMEVNELRHIGINTFIVQDLGIAYLLKKTFEGIELHTSTQVNCHSIYGVRVLEKIGFSRVVLARELSLEEIMKIKKMTKLPLETFAHGALCVSYSGQCLMSSFLGGRSGNRGRCAQPCRLKYKTIIDKMNIGSSYILSPKDIETLSILPELIEAGIDSLKIEGRMKSKEYVGLMTKLYRYYRDQYLTNGAMSIKQKDLLAMAQIFNRGNFSNGYYHQHNGSDMMTIEQPKNQGVVVGKIKKASEKNISVTFFETIVKGDCLEVALTDGSYYSFIADKSYNGTINISVRAKSPVKNGSEIRRIKSVALNKQIVRDNEWVEPKYISMVVTLIVGEPIRLTIYNDSKEVTVEGELVQIAKNQGLTEDRVSKQFLKIGDYPVNIDDITICLDQSKEVFVPVGQMNQLRRKGFEKWYNLGGLEKPLVTIEPRRKIKSSPNSNKNITVLLKNSEQLETVLSYSIHRIYLEWFSFERKELDQVIDTCRKSGVEVYLALPRIVRHENEPMLNILLDELDGRIDGVLVRSIDCYEFIREHLDGRKVQWDYPVHVFNNDTIEFLNSLEGTDGYTVSMELNKREIRRLSLDSGEMIVYGYSKVMTTAQCVRNNTTGCVKEPGKVIHLEDRKGVFVSVETVCQLCYNNLYNGVPHFLVDKVDEMNQMGIGTFRVELLDEKPEEIKKIMDVIVTNKAINLNEMTFTRGHYNKGVE